MGKDYVVFSQKLAGMLMVQGFILKGMKKSTTDATKNVFYFRKSDELLEFIKNNTNK